MFSPDESYQRLLNLKETLIEMDSKCLNEADTRLKIIDTIFVDVLGWSKQDIEVEHSVGESVKDKEHKKLFADYLLQSSQNSFLIEAKRNERYFQLPATLHRTYKQSGVITSNKDNKKFIDQAVNYMNKIGTPFCVLCNGTQIIIIRRMGVHQKKDVLVFKGIDDIMSNFMDFYSILSPLGSGDLHLDKVLERNNELRQPPGYSKSVFDSFVDRFRQTSSTEVRTVTEEYVSKYFSDLTSSKSKIEILKDCYVDPTGKFHEFSQQLRQKVVSDQIKEIKTVAVSDDFKLWGMGNFEKKYTTKLEENDGSVFVLVGGVGAGKSTFINHFYYYEIEESIRKNLIWINLDFLQFTEDPNKVDEFILKEITELLKSENFSKFEINKWETKLKIYKRDLEFYSEGLPPFIKDDPKELEKEQYKEILKWESNQYDHLKSIFSYLRDELNQKVCFVFDNTDQKSDDAQLQVLMSAFKWAKDFQATIITSLRLENYFNAKDKPPFDAYQPIIFRIEPPSVKELLKKRLEVSKQYQKEHFIIDINKWGTTKVFKIPIAKFVTVLENTLEQGSDNYKVEEMLERLSGGNMRRILDIFRTFIQSGNFKLYQNYDYIKRIENVSLSYEEVLESIALGDNKYYQPQDSAIQNIFSINFNDGFNSHFANIYILKYLETKLENHHLNNAFVLLEDLYKKFECLYGSFEAMKDSMEFLLTQFFVESDIGERKALVHTQSIALSELGFYYLNNLLKDWNYFKYIMINTPIKNRTAYEKLNSNIKRATRIQNLNAIKRNNLYSVEIFLQYLRESEEEDLDYIREIFPTEYSTHLRSCIPQVIQDFNHSKAKENVQIMQTT